MNRLTMRSGVSELNDNVIGLIRDKKTAYIIGELLMALDRIDHPEYKGFDVVELQLA